MHPAIRVNNLSMLYRVGARQQGYNTLRESIVDACWSPIDRIRQSFAPKAETDGAAGRLSGENFRALQDVSFEVQPGEVVGIMGRNGAGKSTLLKISSRITEPTSGRIELGGRVGKREMGYKMSARAPQCLIGTARRILMDRTGTFLHRGLIRATESPDLTYE